MLRDREHVLLHDALDERRLEVVIDDDHTVDLARGIQLGEAVGDRRGVRIGGRVAETGPGLENVVAAEPERRAPLLAGDEPADVAPLGAYGAAERKRMAKHLRVEGTG